MGSCLSERILPEPPSESQIELLNDLRVTVEVDLGSGWQALGSWQSRAMARHGFGIRVQDDPTVSRIDLREDLQVCHVSRDLGSFSQQLMAQVRRQWSEMYLQDDAGGELHLVNDLEALVEVDLGDGWRLLYPKQSRRIAASEACRIRLLEAPSVTSAVDLRLLEPRSLRTSEDLGDFSSKASSWVRKERSAVAKEDKEREERKKMLEEKAERRARAQAVFEMCALAAIQAIAILSADLGGLMACAAFGMTLYFMLLHRVLRSPPVKISRAVRRVLLLCFTVLGMMAPVLVLALAGNVEEWLRYVLPLSPCAFVGMLASLLLPGGKWRKKLSRRAHRELREKCIVFEGTVRAEHGYPCITSWPGKYATAWDRLVESARGGTTSAAVVFLPDGTRNYGKHCRIPQSEGLVGDCWCSPVYGEKKPWGCLWWSLWIANVEKAVHAGADLHVYFFEQACGKGKVLNFDSAGQENLRREAINKRMSSFEASEEFQCSQEAGIDHLCSKKRYDSSSQHSREKQRLFLQWLPAEDRSCLEESEGLGNSQKAEVAWLERKGYPFTEVDICKWLRDDCKGDEVTEVGLNKHETIRVKEADDATQGSFPPFHAMAKKMLLGSTIWIRLFTGDLWFNLDVRPNQGTPKELAAALLSVSQIEKTNPKPGTKPQTTRATAILLSRLV
ncbi:unnamed protein product [Effrenium voratum]|uniref:Uncharacterized protein n=1 Tax=Effrenium voratum TaxID=2562239 RepID=A0AA36J5L4_9DINO|nr:unnamed protein product [Effrenium voratum]CAJ1421493.1 unnamed protein product [Effrenium voratum]